MKTKIYFTMMVFGLATIHWGLALAVVGGLLFVSQFVDEDTN